MPTIIDDTAALLSNMGLRVKRVTTPPGYAGIQVDFPQESQAFFVWSKMDGNDFHFRTARFWANENPFSMYTYTNLPEAVAQARVLVG